MPDTRPTLARLADRGAVEITITPGIPPYAALEAPPIRYTIARAAALYGDAQTLDGIAREEITHDMHLDTQGHAPCSAIVRALDAAGKVLARSRRYEYYTAQDHGFADPRP